MKSIGYVLLVFACLSNAQAQDAKSIIDKMFVAYSQLEQYSYTMHSEERFGEHFLTKKMKFHINESPLKVYMRDLESGVELLYAAGWNNGKAFVNPNGFPWMNLSLKINDFNMIKESHHFVSESGFAITFNSMRQTEQKIKDRNEKFEDYVTYKGEVDWNGKKCYKLLIQNKDFEYITHKVTKDESLLDLCTRLGVPEYLVAGRNKIPHGGNVKAGKEIIVPNAFAKEIVLYVDKVSYMPVVQMVYDEKGLYEKYEFRDLSTSPSFHANEFDAECACYGF